MSLTTEELLLVDEFVMITDAERTRAVALLANSAWNLSSAVARFYDDTDPATAESESAPLLEPRVEEFEIVDDAPRAPRSFLFYFRHLFAFPVQIIFFSFPRLAYGFLGFLARTLRIQPLIRQARNPFARDPKATPTACAERWVRALEESTSSVRYSRRNEINAGVSTATASTSLVHRGSASAQRVIPDFLISSYSAALLRAKNEAKVLMIILTCDEHESDAEFKSVLTDPELVATLNNEVLVWAGDVKESDAYQAAKTLQSFSLPFVCFIAPQPRSTTSGAASTASPRMTVISRLEGSTATSALAIVSHITSIVVPRVSPFLRRLRSEAANREAERNARLASEAASARTANLDIERVLRVRQEEDARKQSRIRAEQQEEESGRKARQITLLNEQSSAWKVWARANVLNEEPPESVETIRVGVLLGDGRRAVRRFLRNDTVRKVYTFVECSLDPPSNDPSPALSASSPPANYEHSFEFRLASTFPRVVLEIGSLLSDIGGLGRDVSLVVENLAARRASQGDEGSSDDEEEEPQC